MSCDIHLSKLSKSYDGVHGDNPKTIFDNLNISIKAGELVAIVGVSGCGKSTILNLVANLDEPSRGNINFGTGQTQVKLSMVFQQPRLLDWLTVSENIDLIFDKVSPGESLNSQELILELLN